MEQHVIEIESQIEAIARYLGHTFPTASIRRYEDAGRGVIGFRFLGAAHCNVELSRELVVTLPRDENEVAHELHLRHAGAEINATPTHERLIFTTGGLRREPIA